MNTITEKLQFKIRCYAILSTLLIALIISIVVIYPFYTKLRESEKQGLIFARNTSEIIVNDYVSKIKNVSQEVSNSSSAMTVMQEYRAKSISQKKFQEVGTKELIKILNKSANIVGMMKLDKKGNVVLKAGKTSFFEHKNFKLRNQQLTIFSPVKWGGHFFVNVACPVYNNSSEIIGKDIIAVDITALRANIYKKLQYNQGEILIATVEHGKPTLISPLKSKWNSILSRKNILSSSIVQAVKNNDEGVVAGVLDNQHIYIAYASLDEPGWVLSIIIKKNMLFSDLEMITYLIILIVVGIMLLFVFGINSILKPLSGQIIMHSRDLDKKIQLSQEGLKKANLRLRKLVNHDPLTGAYNRRGFMQEFKKVKSKAKRESGEFTIFFIDVNKFKHINDTYGHDAGDAVLLNISDRLRLSMRDEDVIARIGGDEFVVLSPGVSESEAVNVYNKILAIGQMPIMFEKSPISYHVSIGSATYPIHGKNTEALLSYADDQMYKQKNG